MALEQPPDLSNGLPYTASAAAIALGTGATCKTTYMVRVLLEYARFALVATHCHMRQLPPCELAAKLRKSCSALLIPTRAFT